MKMAGTKLMFNAGRRIKITSPNLPPLSWKQTLIKAHSLCEGNEAELFTTWQLQRNTVY